MKKFIREIPAYKLTPEDIRKMEQVGFVLVIGFDTVQVYANVEEFILPVATEKAA